MQRSTHAGKWRLGVLVAVVAAQLVLVGGDVDAAFPGGNGRIAYWSGKGILAVDLDRDTVQAEVPDLSAPPCPAVADVQALGPACQRPDGLFELYSPYDGSFLGLTHGPDRSRDEPGHAAPSNGNGGGKGGGNGGGKKPTPTPTPDPTPTPSDAEPVCTASPGYRTVVVYAFPSDGSDLYEWTAPSIASTFRGANERVNAAAKATGGVANIKVECDQGEIAVAHAVLATSKYEDSFSSIVSDLKTLGYDDPRAKYLIFYDANLDCGGCAGLAQFSSDDSLAPNNAALRGPMYAVTLKLSSWVFVHEHGHTLGAVQHSSPHSTGAGHCYDGLDHMCYNDGGPTGHLYSTEYCGLRTWDCGYDDYFNVVPEPGSYLATHWNLGSRYNLYYDFGATEDSDAPTFTIEDPRPGTIYQGCAISAATVDGAPPTYEHVGCLNGAVWDASGVAEVRVYWDGRLIQTMLGPDVSHEWSVEGPATNVVLRIEATDLADPPNTSSWATTVNVV